MANNRICFRKDRKFSDLQRCTQEVKRTLEEKRPISRCNHDCLQCDYSQNCRKAKFEAKI